MNTLTFNQNQIIFKQGDFESTMYDVVSGKVGIFSNYGTDEEKKLAEFGRDQVFGEIGMIAVYPRSATAVALEDGTVLAEIGEADLNEYFKDKPEKLLKIMRQVSQRLRETTKNYVDACRTIYEKEEAGNSGTPLSEDLQLQLNHYYSAYLNKTIY